MQQRGEQRRKTYQRQVEVEVEQKGACHHRHHRQRFQSASLKKKRTNTTKEHHMRQHTGGIFQGHQMTQEKRERDAHTTARSFILSRRDISRRSRGSSGRDISRSQRDISRRSSGSRDRGISRKNKGMFQALRATRDLREGIKNKVFIRHGRKRVQEQRVVCRMILLNEKKIGDCAPEEGKNPNRILLTTVSLFLLIIVSPHYRFSLPLLFLVSHCSSHSFCIFLSSCLRFFKVSSSLLLALSLMPSFVSTPSS